MDFHDTKNNNGYHSQFLYSYSYFDMFRGSFSGHGVINPHIAMVFLHAYVSDARGFAIIES